MPLVCQALRAVAAERRETGLRQVHPRTSGSIKAAPVNRGRVGWGFHNSFLVYKQI